MKKPLTWVPWYVDAWIFGSSRIELTRAQRSDFLDLVLLSGKDDGFVRANPVTPYPLAQLAGLLCIDPADLEETIKRCVEVKKIKRFDNGILYVVNWDAYKLTDRWRRKLDTRAVTGADGVAEGENTESNQESNQESGEEEMKPTGEEMKPIEEKSRVKGNGTPFRKTGTPPPDAVDSVLDRMLADQRRETAALDTELESKRMTNSNEKGHFAEKGQRGAKA